MRILIVDDEQPARMALRRLLGERADAEVVGEAANGLEALELILELRPDAVFLDIEMPGLNGFDVLSQCAAPPAVVFVTAYDQHAVRAFEANAVDYLLKPAGEAQIARALDRLRSRGTTTLDAALLRELRAALHAGPPPKIAGRKGRRIVLVARREILCAESEEKLVFLQTLRERVLCDRTLTELEELLTPPEFVRVSRSALVGLEHVEEMFPWMASGAWRVRLRNGSEIDVSRERARLLKKLLGL